ncbi:MAG TPA: cadherin domain-containing protein [Azospirillaceae bacterium]|nr:cadherin domain-containing protein [Azospirillaceae bacterium]
MHTVAEKTERWILTGGNGNDSLTGGHQNDVFQVSGSGQGFDSVDGGAGTDTIRATSAGTVIGLTALKNIEVIDGNGFQVTVSGGAAADALDFSTVTLTGIAMVRGGDGNDTLTGGSANDVLRGDAGDDSLAGGGGTADIAVYAGAKADYGVAKGAGGIYTVSGAEGSDTLSGIEILRFSDGDVSLFDAPGSISDADGTADTVAENAAAGTAVGITAQSVDPNPGDTVAYSLTSDAGGRFQIDAATGVVTVKGGALLNFEAATSHQITVQASDGVLSTSKTFTITVSDVNEAPAMPVDADAATNTVDEGSASGAAVGITAQATDPDAGAAVTYSLADDAGGRFQIDAVTGVVTVKDGTLLDHAAAASHQITVQASDGALASTKSFTIAVARVNFAPSPAEDVDVAPDTVAENAAAGALVGITAFATDANVGDVVTYSLSDDAGGRFQIDAATGVVSVRNGALLNFEAASSHQITVQASDGVASSSRGFTVVVTDANDAPTAPADTDAASDSVAEGAAAGTLVGITAQATDADAGAVLTYSLSNDAGGRFQIDAATGVVTVKDGTLLDHETATGHAIEVVVSDGTASSSKGFTVAVANVVEGRVQVLGAGADTFTAAPTDSWTITGGGGNDTLTGGGHNDVFRFGGTGEGFDQVNGGAGFDRLEATADGTVVGLASIVSVEAISGNGFANVSVAFSDAADTVSLASLALSGIALVRGGGGNDSILGTGAADTLAGDAGNDTLDGGDGDDLFRYGGAGEGFDSVAGGTGNDTIVAGADGTVIGLQAVSGIEAIDAGSYTSVVLRGDNAGNNLQLGAVSLSGISLIDGGAGADTIVGSAAADTIVGGLGADNLDGGDGDDLFLVAAGDGDDLVAGGSGSDTVQAGSAGVTFTFNRLSGVEAISGGGFANVVLAGTSSGDTISLAGLTLTGIARVDGLDGNDTMTGSSGADTLAGGAGNDNLDGGDGDDVFLIAGTGDGLDSIVGGLGNDVIRAAADGTVLSFRGYNGIESISGGGFANVVIRGDAAANTLDFRTIALSGIATIDGAAGNDTIYGSAGDDTLNGGAGADSLVGGAGNDTYLFDNSTLTLDTISDSAGTDTIRATVAGARLQVTGLAGIEALSSGGFSDVGIMLAGGNNNVSLAGMTMDGVVFLDGASGNDTLAGSSFSDHLIGGLGDDSLSGGIGNDTLDGGDGNDAQDGGDGDDLFLINSSSPGTDSFNGGAGFDTVRIVGSKAFTLTTISSIERIEGDADPTYTVQIFGTAGAENWNFSGTQVVHVDMISSGGGNDTVTGSAAGDVLQGAAGNDSLDGGGGDDVFVYVGAPGDASADTVVGGAGNDRIEARGHSAQITLASVSGVELVTANGFTNVSVFGNAAGNVLDFSAVELVSIVSIDGQGGNDSLVGSVGADNLLGNLGDDTLRGGDGADTLTGGGGRDVMHGGAGADRFRYATTTDTTTAAQADRIEDFTVGSDIIDLLNVDANSLNAGNDAFSWLGTAAFSKVAGQLRHEFRADGNTWILGDRNGDGVSDFEIVLTGTITLAAGDFVL